VECLSVLQHQPVFDDRGVPNILGSEKLVRYVGADVSVGIPSFAVDPPQKALTSFCEATLRLALSFIVRRTADCARNGTRFRDFAAEIANFDDFANVR
jgi:hypothetical protein